MGFLDGLFGGSAAPTPKKIEAQVENLRRRHGDPAMRYAAADQLAAWGTPEAVYGLLLRFAVNVASETSDEEEKAHVAELLTDKIGAPAIPQIETFLRREEQVSWPLRILARLVSPEEFRAKLLRALASFDTHFDQHPDRKVDVIHVLADHAEHAEVADGVARFLEDTDDSVRLAAIALLGRSERAADLEPLVDCLLASPDRPRVRAAIVDALVGRKLPLGTRRDDVVRALPPGLSLSLDDVLTRTERATAPARKA